MATKKLKIMLSFMREINDGNLPCSKDYDITDREFWDIIETAQDEELIKGASFAIGGGKKLIAYLDDVRLTFKGLEYLNEHSVMMKTYKGLKEIRYWLPL